MSLNRDLIGRTYDGVGSFEVSREHIRRFAQAIGDSNPAYTDPEAAKALGHPDVIAPPTFLTTVGMSMAGRGPISDPELAGGIGAHTGFWRTQARYIDKLSKNSEMRLVAAVGED